MKHAIKASILAMTLAVSPAFANVGGDLEGNGGAGLATQGRYMTFYSAGLYTEPLPKINTEVPSLEKLVFSSKTFPIGPKAPVRI